MFSDAMQTDRTAPAIEALEQQLTTLAGHLNAGNYRFLKLLAEFERCNGHVGWGIASCAHWLSWKCGLSLVASRDRVRVARALESLPQISAAMERGTISYCKARALTRVATPENEALLVQIAEHSTVSHVEKIVRLHQGADRAAQLSQANEQYARRQAQCYVDEQGFVVVRARLAPEQGAVFMKALQSAVDALRDRDPREEPVTDATPCDPTAALRADALALMAESLLNHEASPASDRHLVTVHVDERVLRNPESIGQCEIETVPGEAQCLPPATVRRMCCDGSFLALVETADGTPVATTRKTRVISSAQRRALQARDGGCRFPGCSNSRYTDAHHIIHWADGGETSLGNLILLCRKHHRYLHEHGYWIERDAERLQFIRPDGRRIPDSPRPTPCPSAHGYAELRSAHEHANIHIDEDTAVPHWDGSSPDYNWIEDRIQSYDEAPVRFLDPVEVASVVTRLMQEIESSSDAREAL